MLLIYSILILWAALEQLYVLYFKNHMGLTSDICNVIAFLLKFGTDIYMTRRFVTAFNFYLGKMLERRSELTNYNKAVIKTVYFMLGLHILGMSFSIIFNLSITSFIQDKD